MYLTIYVKEDANRQEHGLGKIHETSILHTHAKTIRVTKEH